MSIALPALLIVMAVLPGIVFVRAYLAGRFARRVAQVSPLTELGLYVIVALPILGAALAAHGERHPYIVAVLARGISGTLERRDVDKLLDVPARELREFFFEYAALLVLAAFAGALVRRLVWTIRADLYVPVLKMKNEWFYKLSPRQIRYPRGIAVWADILTKERDRDENRLYRGLVDSFDVDKDGALSVLVLQHARRGKGRGDGFEWKAIPSNRFMIFGGEIHSVNLQYVVMDENPGLSVAGFRWAIGRLFRAFWFEESY